MRLFLTIFCFVLNTTAFSQNSTSAHGHSGPTNEVTVQVNDIDITILNATDAKSAELSVDRSVSQMCAPNTQNNTLAGSNCSPVSNNSEINNLQEDAVQIEGRLCEPLDSKKIKAAKAVIRSSIIERFIRLNEYLLNMSALSPDLIPNQTAELCSPNSVFGDISRSLASVDAHTHHPTDSNAGTLCDSRNCDQSFYEMGTDIFRRMGGTGSFTRDNLAGDLQRLQEELENRAKSSECFLDPRQSALAKLVSMPGLENMTNEDRIQARRGILQAQLSALDGLGDINQICRSSDTRRSFRRTLLNSVNDGVNENISRAFFSSFLAPTTRNGNNNSKPALQNPFFSAFKFNPALYFQLKHRLQPSEISREDCQAISANLNKMRRFYDESLSSLNASSESDQFNQFSNAYKRFSRDIAEDNSNVDTSSQVSDEVSVRCNSLKVAFTSLCYSDEVLSANPMFRSFANASRCRARTRTPEINRASDIITNIVSGISVQKQSSADYSNNTYCPHFKDFIKDPSFSCQDTITSCLASMTSDQRVSMQASYFRWLEQNHPSSAVGIRERHAAIGRASQNLDGVIDSDGAIRRLQEANRTAGNSRISSDPNFARYASVLGSISVDRSFSAVSSGSLISANAAQAFAAQTRAMSPATSTSMMNRFIAKVPPIQSMNSSEAQQQVGQAFDSAVTQTVSELENRVASSTDAAERQRYLDEIAELRRMLTDQNARNELINQQIAAMNQSQQTSEDVQPGPRPRQRRAPASDATAISEPTQVTPSGFQIGGGRSSGGQAATGSQGQEFAGVEGFGQAGAGARNVGSIQEALNTSNSADSNLRLVLGGNNAQQVQASSVVSVTVVGNNEQAIKQAILAQKDRLSIDEDGFALVEVIDSQSGRATLVRVRIENEDVIVQNLSAEELRNVSLVSESSTEDPKPVRYFTIDLLNASLRNVAGESNQ